MNSVVRVGLMCSGTLLVASWHGHGGTLIAIAGMDGPRAAHTTTTVPDGRTLVVGGFGATDGTAAPALVFDPRSTRFGTLKNVVDRRHSHTATLLSDGSVLVVGGYGEGGAYLSSAEVIDIARGTVRRVGSLNTARADHVATALHDGRILITGGVGAGWTFLSSTEIYDPMEGTFVVGAAMTVPRESHVAVLLHDGRVLVAGGHVGRRAQIRIHDGAEIFDASLAQFIPTGAMVIPRHKHDAVTLADGRVLVLGGADDRDSRGVYASTELFDPGRGQFALHVPMQRPRYKHEGATVILADGRLLLAGGAAQPEVYEPTTQRFRLVRSAHTLRGQFSAAAVLSDGRVLITGGYSDRQGPTAAAWIFRPS